MVNFFCLVLAGCLLLFAPSVRAIDDDVHRLQASIQTVIRRTFPSVVAVTQARAGVSSAFSGVIVSQEGHVLAVAHTVKPGAQYLIHLTDGRQLKAQGLGVCLQADLAMIKITDEGNWPYVDMGRSELLIPGQPCVSISHPATYNPQRGAVVRVGQIVRPLTAMQGMVQSTALMEPGDSGGALFDLEGRLVAIHSQIQQALDENYEVPVDSYRTFWDNLQVAESFEIDQIPGLPNLGFTGRRSRRPPGVRIVDVQAGSVAERAGLKADDQITRLNGDHVTSWSSLSLELRENYILGKRQNKLMVLSNGEENEVELHLSEAQQLDVQTTTDSIGTTDSSIQRSSATNDWSRVQRKFDDLEQRLDDCCVKIFSQQHDRQMEIVGWFVDRSGRVLSKSSCVGREPKALLAGGDLLALEVERRDEALDLILLRLKLPSENATPINHVNLKPTERPISREERGLWLISPSPQDNGKISVLGSAVFTAPRLESRGYLGVTLSTIENQVCVVNVDRNGAARSAGIREDDIIASIDEQSFTDHTLVREYLSRQLPEQTVRVEIVRSGESLAKVVRLGRPAGPRHIAEAFDGGKSLRRDGFAQVACHDARLMPNECGGPVFDIEGRFLGMNIARFSRARCYLLPATEVHKFLAGTTPFSSP